MSWDDEVLEPTEIIIEEPTISDAKSRKIFPWMRLLARIFDYFLLYTILRYFLPYLAKLYWGLIPLIYFFWIPFEALFLSQLGFTPGKWMFFIRVLGKNRKKLSYKRALQRSFLVWFRGIGLGIPFISVITIFYAYTRLISEGMTSWDREQQCQITHKKVPTYRFFIAGTILLIIYTFLR